MITTSSCDCVGGERSLNMRDFELWKVSQTERLSLRVVFATVGCADLEKKNFNANGERVKQFTRQDFYLSERIKIIKK